MVVRKPSSPKRISAFASVVLIFALSGAPDVMSQNVPAQPQSQPQSGITIDPSQAPLQPSQTTLPEAPSPTPEQQSQPSDQQPHTTMTAQPSPVAPAPATQQQTQPSPLGAAAAQGIRTTGGGASRPAGSAIAPAKQRQTRSLLIKAGLIAATGIAIGTVYALSRGTSSTPPNTGR